MQPVTTKIARFNFPLTILFLQDHGYWVAQCLEYDITAQGKTIDAAKLAFERTFVGQVLVDTQKGKEPLEGELHTELLVCLASRRVVERFSALRNATHGDVPVDWVHVLVGRPQMRRQVTPLPSCATPTRAPPARGRGGRR